MMNRVLYAIAALCLVALPFAFIAPATYWHGSFPLSISVARTESIDRDSVMYYECWDDIHARWICDYMPELDVDFKLPAARNGRTDLIYVSHSGSERLFGMIATYERPSKLCVQFDLVDEGGVSRYRRAVAIPDGREQRTLIVNLP